MGDPVPLPADVTGSGPRLVLVHGFTQTARTWAPLVDDLASDHEVVAVDVPGHGRAAHLGLLDLWAGAEALAATGGRATYVGYSLGGRLALHLALAHPDLMSGLVLISATAGIDDPEERARRRADDDALALRFEREPLADLLRWWTSQPLFAGLDPAAADLDSRLANDPAGLAASLRHAGTGRMDPPLWDRLDEMRGAGLPVLVVTGERDARFTALGRRLVAGIGPTARLEVVPGVGHAVPWEDPAATVALLRGFRR